MQIRLSTFVIKEMLHILRDPRTMLVVLVIPVTLILLFGFTVSTDVRQIDVAVCAPRRSAAVDESVRHLEASELVTLTGYVDEHDIDKVLRTGAASAVVCYAADYVTSGRLQILLDGADVNTATITQAYLQQILSGSAAQPSLVEMHQIFNPQMKSSFNFIPGIMGMIFLLICAMMTSVSIVKEKETGTMEVLLVSPVKPAYIIISKMVPYLLLGGIDLAVLGIGEDCHIGYNEPGTLYDTHTHVQKLTDRTKRQLLKRGFTDSDMPEQAVTMGIKELVSAREILLLASGREKAGAVYQMLYAKNTSYIPAAYLQLPPEVTVLLDTDAAAEL